DGHVTGVQTCALPISQLALPVEADVGGKADGLGLDVDRERRAQLVRIGLDRPEGVWLGDGEEGVGVAETPLECRAHVAGGGPRRDRKSTRLNSSHVAI